MLTGPELADRLRRVRGRWPDSPYHLNETESGEMGCCCLAAVALDAKGDTPEDYKNGTPLIAWICDNIPYNLRIRTECAYGFPGSASVADWDAAIAAAESWKEEKENLIPE